MKIRHTHIHKYIDSGYTYIHTYIDCGYTHIHTNIDSGYTYIHLYIDCGYTYTHTHMYRFAVYILTSISGPRYTQIGFDPPKCTNARQISVHLTFYVSF